MDATHIETPTRPTWWPVVLVLLLALGVHGWVVARSEVAARDSIGFIKMALRFEQEPIAKVLRESEQPPAYAFTVLIASWPVRAWQGGVTPDGMALAAQLASAFFGVLLVLPMIGFGSELIDRRFGCVAAALFQCLPSWVRFTSDGLSEALFLFCVATALWLSARAFRTQSRWSFAACGLAAGLAYLARPEGAALIAAVSVILLALAWLRQIEWRTAMFAGAALSVGFLMCCAPYVATIGRFTNKPTGNVLMGDPVAEKSYFGQTTGSPAVLAVWWSDGSDPNRNRWLWAVQSLIVETAASARYVGFALAIFGFTQWPKRIRNTPGGAVVMVLAAGHALLLIRMTSSIGYLSERHTALLVFAGCYVATLGLIELACRFVRYERQRAAEGFVLGVIVATTFATAWPSLKKPLHGNRAGHKAAGLWLAANAPEATGIRDPFCWGRYYAGRDFREIAAPEPDDQFVIIERSDNQHSRLPLIPEVRAKAAVGQLVYHWPPQKPAAQAQVAVYRWQRPATDPNAKRSSPPAGGGE